MRKRTTVILLALVVLVGIYIAVFERGADASAQRAQRARLLFQFDPAGVEGFALAAEDLQIACEREGAGWRLTSPMAARADAGVVEAILEALAAVPRGEVITRREQTSLGLSDQDYGLDAPRYRLTLRLKGRELPVQIGRVAPVGNTLFVRAAGKPEIFTARTNLLALIPATLDGFRDRRIFQGHPAEAVRLDLRRRDGFVQLARVEPERWRIRKPVDGRAAIGGVQDLLESIYRWRIRAFVAESSAALSLFGLDQPQAQVTLAVGTDAAESALLIGHEVAGITNELYATLSGGGPVFTVDRRLLDDLNFDLDALRDRRLLDLSAHEIGTLAAERPGGPLAFARRADGWEMTAPARVEAEGPPVELLLAEWTGARIEGFLESAGTNAAPAGRAAFTVVFGGAATSSNAPAGEGRRVAVDVVSETATNGLLPVRVSGETATFLIRPEPVAILGRPALFFRSRSVARVKPAEVKFVELRAEGRGWRVERDTTNAAFRCTNAAERVREGAVEEVLACFAPLVATDLVAENSPDLAGYGLSPPAATVTLGFFGGESGISKTLLLGAARGTNEICGMIQGQDLVFVVPRATCDRLRREVCAEPPTTPEAAGGQSRAP